MEEKRIQQRRMRSSSVNAVKQTKYKQIGKNIILSLLSVVYKIIYCLRQNLYQHAFFSLDIFIHSKYLQTYYESPNLSQ